MKKSEIWLGAIRIPLDFGMMLLAFWVAYQLRQQTDLIPGLHFPIDILNFPSLSEYMTTAAWSGVALIGIFMINQMYSFKNTSRIGGEIIKVGSLVSAWIMVIIAYYFVTRQFFFSRLVLGYIWILSTLFIATGRIALRLLQRQLCRMGIGRRRILILGNNSLSRKVARKLAENPTYQIIGAVTKSGKSVKKSKLRVLGKLQDLPKITQRHRIEEIIQTQSDLSGGQAHGIIDFCREKHIQYHFVPDILEIHRTQVDVFNIAGLPLISLKITPLEGWGKVIKRIFDIIASFILLIVLSPLLLLISIGIKLDSNGPIVFCRKDDGSPVTRVGLRGRLIRYYKFRSMRHKTDNLRYTKLADKNHRKGTPLVKIKNDPRVTTFGRFLRRWSLDELPQLWSVLTGDLSLVGPRAHLPEEVAKYEKHHKFALSIKPGITGLAQVNGRSDLNFEEEIQFDTYYIENWSLLLDVKILFRTIFVVLDGEGAD